MWTIQRTLEEDIEQEYLKINKKWLYYHYFISAGLVLLTLILEIGIGRLMYVSGEISTTIFRYLFKYLLLPTTINLLLILLTSIVLFSRQISQIHKTYTVSLTMVAICFVIFTIHGSFTSLFYIFSVPILLPAIYGQYKLSVLTSLSSNLALILSELFIKWDPDGSAILEDGMRLGNFLISLVTLLSLAVVCLIIIYFEDKKNRVVLRKEIERLQLQKKLEIDDLTGIYNRNAFRNAIEQMTKDGPAGSYFFAMIDVDHFKQLNDSLGHVAGDNCLKSLGKILMNAGKDALAFRYGGDEFSLLFKNSSKEEVLSICSQIQKEVNTLAETFKTPLPLSVSIGIAHYTENISPHDLIENSDTALYQAKKKKNDIILYDDSLREDDKI